MTIEPEQWRPVIGWEAQYEVSDLGRVRSLATGTVLKGCKNSKGYIRINLPAPETKRKQTCKMLHRLVLEAFVGPPPANAVCCHGPNGITDNSLANLSWATQQQNVQDRKRDGTNNHPRPRAQGVGNHQAKLTEREAKEILRARGNCSQASLAARYKVSPALISAIHRGKKWGHLQQQSTSSPPAKGALP
jgi:hypothetical protein